MLATRQPPSGKWSTTRQTPSWSWWYSSTEDTLKPHRKPAGVWSLEPYYRTVNWLLGRARFKDLKRPCAIQATDLTNLRPVIFSRDVDPYMEVAFAVKASSAVPGLMSPVEWGGLVLADGGAFVDLARLPIRAPRIVNIATRA